MKKPTKRNRVIVITLVAVLAVVVIVALVGRNRGGGEKTAVSIEAVSRGTVVSSVSATGVLKSLTTVEVKSNVGGQVIQLAVDEGDVVRAGQLIARIDPSDTLTSLQQSQAEYDSASAKVRQAVSQANVQPKLTDTAIRQAESSLESARATLNQTKNALIPQKIASAQSSYNQAKAAADQAAKNLKRQKALYDQGFVARSEVDSAEETAASTRAQLGSAQSKWTTVKGEADQDLKAAQARVQEAAAALESAKAGTYQVGVKREDIVQAKADLQRARASVDNARTQLGYTSIYAPRSGVVVSKYVEEGSIVMAGRSANAGTGSGVTIVDIADVTRMQVEVNVDEADIGQIRTGQLVQISVDAYPDERFRGRVTKIAPQAVEDSNVTTIPVTVEVAGQDARLKPGMNAACDFIVERKEAVLVVPNKAVKESAGGTTVTVMRQGKPVVSRVQTGISDDKNTEIISGLQEGDPVVTGANGMNGGDTGSPAAGVTGNNQSSGGSSRRMRGGPPRMF
ncbi:MAG: efflux RND transporter periplasmic adaptor subunit [bacterium]|nr:efflux RND transporter periplasmic adaptor subunit [bacterium]